MSGDREIPYSENSKISLDSASAEKLGYAEEKYRPRYRFKRAAKLYVRDSFQTSSFNNKILDFYHHDVLSLQDTFTFVLHDSVKGETKFVFPIKGRVSSGFGPRYFWGYHFHYGTDIALARGDTIVSAMDGTVRIVRVDRWGYGNYIVVTHDNGLETLYGHLDKSLVTEGQAVKAGQLIGLGGNTGRSTGPHLHFEFRFMGEQFDPEHVCDFEHGTLKKGEIAVHKGTFKHLDKSKPSTVASSRTARTSNVKAMGAGGAVYHTIRAGENLGKIARMYNTSVGNLCRINGISPRTVIYAGKRIRVK